jgi:hypothetical protein
VSKQIARCCGCATDEEEEKGKVGGCGRDGSQTHEKMGHEEEKAYRRLEDNSYEQYG